MSETKPAKRLDFRISERGNGYGEIFAVFQKGEEERFQNIALVSLCCYEEVAATIVAILKSYNPEIISEISPETIHLIMVESEMRSKQSEYWDLKKKIEKETKNDTGNSKTE